MNTSFFKSKWVAVLAAAGVVGVLASCASMSPMMGGQKVELSGTHEVPAVATTAAGTATVTIKDDRSVVAVVTVTGMTATASHIHEAAAGSNARVVPVGGV